MSKRNVTPSKYCRFCAHYKDPNCDVTGDLAGLAIPVCLKAHWKDEVVNFHYQPSRTAEGWEYYYGDNQAGRDY